MYYYSFVIKKRDGGSWDLGKNDFFLLLRLQEFYVFMQEGENQFQVLGVCI